MNELEFIESLKKLNIALNDQQLEQFRKYAQILVEYNEKVNLTAIVETNEIYEKHFYDSILACDSVKMEGRLCDVGAGAGFPSIPLKIVFEDLDVTIVEPLMKRCVFLNTLCKELNLNVQIENARAEDFVKEHRESFDIVTARAVANLRVLSELCIPLVKMDGIFLALKGSGGDTEVKQAQNATTSLGCKLIDSKEYFLSDQSSRKNFVYKKVKNTDKKYPRMYSKIKKSPL